MNLRQRKIDLLNTQLERSKAAFNNQSQRLQGQRYNEIATNRFQADIQPEAAGQYLDEVRQQN